MIVGYDFEVFYEDWLVEIIDPELDEPIEIINDPELLYEIYHKYKGHIWVGYNNRHYDQYIMKAILCGMDPYDVSCKIIQEEQPGWSISRNFNKYPMINYDVQILGKGLKELEAFQGHSIYESSVDFNIKRKLTDEEIRETCKYCLNDVIETMNVFQANIEDFNSQWWLVHEFKLPLSFMAKTKAQISAEILGCVKTTRNDEWDLYTLDCVDLGKYKVIGTWFMDKGNHFYKDQNGNKNKLECIVAGVPHIFAWGGAHGAKVKYHYKCEDGYLMLHVDVTAFYPSLMIEHGLLTRNAKHPERFKAIYDRRVALKKAGKKKEQAPLKIVINGSYGICKDLTNNAYDPRNANLICVNGQLLLVDLIDKLEDNVPSFELIQSNTDGLIIKIRMEDFDLVDDVCAEWEERCSVNLEFDYIQEIWQKDVNNYIFRDFDGNLERKGAYVKYLSPLDNDLPIVNTALVDYMTKGVPVEQTINSCDEMVQFQKVCKLSKKFDHVVYTRWIYAPDRGHESTYYNKCYRVFASTDPVDGPVHKVKGNRYNKFPMTSEHSFLESGDITDMKCPDKLDKQWYIDLAKTRLTQFGVNV